MTESWRPQRSQSEALERAARSMIPGSWSGRIAQAMPVKTRRLNYVDSLDDEQIAQITGAIGFETHESYTITASDLAAGVASFMLSRKPIDESVTGYTLGLPQPPSVCKVAGNGVTWTLLPFQNVGDVLHVHYAYVLETTRPEVLIPWRASGWKYLPNISDSIDRSAPGFNDSSWATGTAPFSWTASNTLKLWMRKSFPLAIDVGIRVDIEDHGNIYVNGVKVLALPFKGPGVAHGDRTILYPLPNSALKASGTNLLAVEAIDDTASETNADIQLEGVRR